MNGQEPKIESCGHSAKLDSALIEHFVNSFPADPEWTILLCSQIGQLTGAGKVRWNNIAHLKGVGGVYAFFLPASYFASTRTIHLHGPKKSVIPFEFSIYPANREESVIVYIGRTSNLGQRLAAHLRYGERQASGQVKYGLIDSGVCKDQLSALAFIRQHGRVVFRILDKPEQTANRDIVELCLCARYHPPFNIKAER